MDAAHVPELVLVAAILLLREAAPEPREPVRQRASTRVGGVWPGIRREGDEAPARDGRGAGYRGDCEHQVHDWVQVQQQEHHGGQVGEEGHHEVDQALCTRTSRRVSVSKRKQPRRGGGSPCWNIIFQRLLRPGMRYNPIMVRISTVRSVNMARGWTFRLTSRQTG